MDEILRDKLESIRDMILKTFFDNNTISKWKKDKEIDLDTNTFQVLFYGDWNRNTNTKLNLTNLNCKRRFKHLKKFVE